MLGHFVSYLNRLGNIYETRNFSFVVELSSAGRNKLACFCCIRPAMFGSFGADMLILGHKICKHILRHS